MWANHGSIQGGYSCSIQCSERMFYLLTLYKRNMSMSPRDYTTPKLYASSEVKSKIYKHNTAISTIVADYASRETIDYLYAISTISCNLY